MSNVIPFTGITTVELDPDVVLDNTRGKLDGFIILGYDLDGEEYFASTYADSGDMLWLIERFKMHLLNLKEDDR